MGPAGVVPVGGDASAGVLGRGGATACCRWPWGGSRCCGRGSRALWRRRRPTWWPELEVPFVDAVGGRPAGGAPLVPP